MSDNWGTWGNAHNSAATQAIKSSPAYRVSTLEAWKSAKEALDSAQVLERALRDEVVALFATNKDVMASGTETVETPLGKLKIEHKLNYSLGDADEVDKALDLIEKSQEGGNVIAERLVKWEPQIYVGEYKKLNDKQKAIIDKVLTIKPATKAIKIEPIKGA
jgi:hypothetical protein